jgi:hypothetical protein
MPELPDLELRLRSPRTLFSYLMSIVAGLMTLVAMLPLFSVLFRLMWEGGKRISLTLFIDLPPAAGMVGGGIGNALLGTLLMVGIASLISVPLGTPERVLPGAGREPVCAHPCASKPGWRRPRAPGPDALSLCAGWVAPRSAACAGRRVSALAHRGGQFPVMPSCSIRCT